MPNNSKFQNAFVAIKLFDKRVCAAIRFDMKSGIFE